MSKKPEKAPKSVAKARQKPGERAEKAPQKVAPVTQRQRVVIVGFSESFSATAFLKALGKLGFTNAQAKQVCDKWASSELAASTITTGMSDGRSVKYAAGAAALTKADIARVVKLVGKAGAK